LKTEKGGVAGGGFFEEITRGSEQYHERSLSGRWISGPRLETIDYGMRRNSAKYDTALVDRNTNMKCNVLEGNATSHAEGTKVLCVMCFVTQSEYLA